MTWNPFHPGGGAGLVVAHEIPAMFPGATPINYEGSDRGTCFGLVLACMDAKESSRRLTPTLF